MLVKWIVKYDHPFTVLEEADFRTMSKIMNSEVQIPSADTIRNEITTTFEREQKKIRKELQVCLRLIFTFKLVINLFYLLGSTRTNLLYL